MILSPSDLQRAIADIMNQFKQMIQRATITGYDSKNGSDRLHIKALGNQEFDAEHFEHFGFLSCPPLGSECIVAFPGGDRRHPVVIAVNDRKYRTNNLEPGEVAIHNAFGDSIKLDRQGTITVNARKLVVEAANSVEIKAQNSALFQANEITLKATSRIEMSAPAIGIDTSNLTINASEKVQVNSSKLQVDGDVVDHAGSAAAKSMSDMRDVFNRHTHSVAGPVAQKSTDQM